MLLKEFARKLHICILLHFGLVTFRIDLGTSQTPFNFMVFKLGGRVHGPQNQLSVSLETPRYLNKIKNSPRSCLKTINFIKFIFLDIQQLGKLWKRRAPEIQKSRRILVWKPWIWDQYLQENVRWKFDKS